MKERTGGRVEIDKENPSSASKINYTELFNKIGGKVDGSWPYGKIVGDIKDKKLTIRITTKHIIILDQHMVIKSVFENRNILRFVYVDKNWVYALRARAIGYDNI